MAFCRPRAPRLTPTHPPRRRMLSDLFLSSTAISTSRGRRLLNARLQRWLLVMDVALANSLSRRAAMIARMRRESEREERKASEKEEPCHPMGNLNHQLRPFHRDAGKSIQALLVAGSGFVSGSRTAVSPLLPAAQELHSAARQETFTQPQTTHLKNVRAQTPTLPEKRLGIH
ncbi:hypothetical protein AOLI_G00027340 [Acnodon oligacanthus]